MNLPRDGFPVCANCGRRPGSVRVVLAAEGGGKRAGALCEVCAREFFALAGGAAPKAAPQQPQSRTPALDVVILGGQPIREPIAMYGPFVMNTRQEVMDAFTDYQAGRLGSIPAQYVPHGGVRGETGQTPDA